MKVRLLVLGPLLVMAQWAGAASVSPAAGSDAVLALHPQPHNELQLQYLRESAGQDPQTVVVGLGPDYHYVRDVPGLRIYDYALRRIYSVVGGKLYANDSLYAEVWFRVSELESRVRLRKAMQSGSLPAQKVADLNNPFWIETDLAVTSGDLPRPVLQRSEVGDRAAWSLDGTEVVAVRYDSEPVPASVRGGLRRLWSTFGHVHPDIADELAASGRVPKELWVMTQRLGKETGVVHWTLEKRNWEARARYPLPSHLAAAPTQSKGAFPEIFALLTQEVADKKRPPGTDVYVARAQAAIDRGAGIDAMLWLIEMNLAQGHPEGACTAGDPRVFCALSAKAGPLVNNDPRFAAAFARQSPDLADRARYDGLANAYLLRLLWATRPAGKDVQREGTERDLLAALTASPVADFTKDAGDFYATGWQAFAAWQVWDLGRLMAGHTPDDLLHPIDSLEDQLYIGEPSLF